MLYKTLFVLAIVATFAIMLYAGSGPTMPFNPTVPTFGGPQSYALQIGTLGLTIVGNATWGLSSTNFQYGNNAVSPVVTYNTTTPCAEGAHVTGVTAYPGEYWDCLNTKDGEASLVGMSGLRYTNGDGVLIDGYQFGVQLSNISGIDLRYQVLNVTIETQCNTQTANPVDFSVDIIKTNKVLGSWPNPPYSYPQQVSIGTGFPIGSTKCGYGTPPGPFGDTWFNVTNFINYQSGLYVSGQRLGNFSGAQMAITVNTWGQSIYISYMSVTINYLVDNSVTTQTCVNLAGFTDIGCVISNIWNWLTTFIVFVVGGIVSTVVYLGEWTGFLLQSLANYASVIVWLYSIPGMYSMIQLFVSGIVTIWLVIIGVEVYKLIHPFKS